MPCFYVISHSLFHIPLMCTDIHLRVTECLHCGLHVTPYYWIAASCLWLPLVLFLKSHFPLMAPGIPASHSHTVVPQGHLHPEWSCGESHGPRFLSSFTMNDSGCLWCLLAIFTMVRLENTSCKGIQGGSGKMTSLNVGSASPWIQLNRKRKKDGTGSSVRIIALCSLTC